MNANIQQEWQINLGQGWALMLWRGRQHCGACWGKKKKKKHTHMQTCTRLKDTLTHTVMCVITIGHWLFINHSVKSSSHGVHIVLIDNLELHYAKDLNIQCAFVFVFFQKPSETREDEVFKPHWSQVQRFPFYLHLNSRLSTVCALTLLLFLLQVPCERVDGYIMKV